jgi:hypothetical protein
MKRVSAQFPVEEKKGIKKRHSSLLKAALVYCRKTVEKHGTVHDILIKKIGVQKPRNNFQDCVIYIQS